jgi:Leucine-rich repeat (LRR) protein
MTAVGCGIGEMVSSTQMANKLSGNSTTSATEARSQSVALNCRGQNLTSVPEEVLKSKSVQVLILAENALTSLPEEFGELSELRTLDLGHSHLERLPRSFAQLTKLSITSTCTTTGFPNWTIPFLRTSPSCGI